MLGPLAVWSGDGTAVRVPDAKVRTLLAALLTRPGQAVSADRLIDALWPERPPRDPAGTLQARVSQLRRALEDAEPGGRARVVTRPPGYAVEGEVDAVRFAALVEQARAVDDPQAKAGLLSDALALWRGPAFAGFADEEFARPAVARLDELRLTAVEEHAEARLALGEHAALADELAEAVAEHPLRERLRAVHLRALYRAGRQGEALAGYDDLRVRLSEVLGADPGPELAALHQAILRQDPALTPRRSNLPAPLTRLVGRDAAVRETGALLAAARLVTLTGPGGVGKTRLALEAAAAHPEDVWLVELAAARPRDELAELVAGTLGVRDQSPAGLADALRPRRLLLVLDNCEHVAEPVAELAARLLAAAPGLRVLATSREPLGVPGERVLAVPPLAPDDAAALFAARAPGLIPDAESEPWIATICKRLDNLPLALELAATRVPAFGVRGLAERLDDRFGVLDGGRRGGPARQRTLRAVIDWSWEPLPEEERAALRRLAVHADGCTLEAAEATCGPAGVLARLVDRSLVVRTGDRYRLLESVAAYALERLREAGEEDEARRRHARYYTGLAERADPLLRGPEQVAWLARLDAEAANLRAALAVGEYAPRLVDALSWYWFLRGRAGEARRATAAVPQAFTWHTAFTMLSGEGSDSEELRLAALARDDRPWARWFLSFTHWPYGDLAANEARIEEALAGFRAAGDRWGTAAALATRAKTAVVRGDLAAMERDAAESRALFGELGDAWGTLEATDALGRAAEITGDYPRAAALRRDCLRLARELGMKSEEAFALAGLGRVALLTGDLDEARDLHEQAHRLAVRHAARSAQEFAEVGLGLVARRRGDLGAAETHLRAVLGWLRRIGGGTGVAFALTELGFVAEQRGDAAAALALHREAHAIALGTGDPRAVALALEGLAGARSLAGEHAEATRLLAEAEGLRAAAGVPLPPGERGDVDRIRARLAG
ncbi:hypothetical protein ACRB68_38080 [Actinomadura sp. RB68]|uniref:OmpR/PhoB-type domain-containing protein n=1 Tax=Actinomadura macrotermitis TaxID=2585200 RepID=A0A7K0BX20_9ACTN|nr:hypothetical protein [Actinomadura macrotermitis]